MSDEVKKSVAQEASEDILQPMHYIKTKYILGTQAPLAVRSIMRKLWQCQISADEARQQLRNI